MFSSSTNINQKPTLRQQKQHILKSGQQVYLYGDTRFSGTLLRPVERTYPPLAHSFAPYGDAGSLARWTVELDRGGYDSPTVSEITPVNPQYIDSESAIPFNDSKEKETESEPESNTSNAASELTNITDDRENF